jgi:lipopolysaccharide export system protein LptC
VKSNDWLGNLVSILFFAGLALAAWGLSEVLQRGGLGSPTAASGPNAIVESARIIRTDALGKPQYRLEAKRIAHYDDGDQSLFDQPVMVSLSPDKPVTIVKANQAVATNNQNQIDLSGDVRIDRAAFGAQPEARITTSKATLFVEEERAITDAPVFVQRGLSTLQGVGMRFDQKTQKIDIISESRMVVPKESRK